MESCLWFLVSTSLWRTIVKILKNKTAKKVQEKKQGFFRRVWEAIKAFIKKILDGIGNFFHWLGSFFNANDKKIEDISKNADQIVEKAKEPATEAFSSSTGETTSTMTAEVVMANPEKTTKMLKSYYMLLTMYVQAFDSLGLLLLDEYDDALPNGASLKKNLTNIAGILNDQYQSGICLVEFDKTHRRGASFETSDDSEHDYPIVHLKAPKRVSFKNPNVKSIINAYASCGWITKPVLTSGFAEMERQFKGMNEYVSDLSEKLSKIHARYDSISNKQKTMGEELSHVYNGEISRPKINIHDAHEITMRLCKHVPILIKTYGAFYKKFGQMLDDIHHAIGDESKN